MSTDTRQQALIHWLQQMHLDVTELRSANADASARRYFRFENQGKSFIAVDTPLSRTDNEAFIELAKALSNAGLRTPDIHLADTASGWMVIEDFGSITFANALAASTDTTPLYQQAIELITEIHASTSLQTLSQTLPKYREEMVLRELSIFPQWCLQGHLGIQLDAADNRDWNALLSLCVDVFAEQPQTFVHRDFHSRNLMRLADHRLGLLDFQGAVRGPMTYDWVSLLRDCYIDLPEAHVASHLSWSYEQSPLAKAHSFEEVHRWFDLTGLQRHLKAIGIFCRLKQQDNKISYMADVPRTFNYILTATEQHSELKPLARIIEKHKLVERLC